MTYSLPGYHCDNCGATHPARGGRPRHKGGNACRACRVVNRELQAVRDETYDREMVGAPELDHGARIQWRERALSSAHAAWEMAAAALGVQTDVSRPVPAEGRAGGMAGAA